MQNATERDINWLEEKINKLDERITFLEQILIRSGMDKDLSKSIVHIGGLDTNQQRNEKNK